MTRKILVVDDEDLVLRTLKILLTKNGYELEMAPNAVEAITLAAKENFDLVISDIRMPGDNGILAVRKIKELYESKGILCAYIFLTGYAEEDTPAHAIQLGVNKFLFKPFDNEILLKSIKEEIDLIVLQREAKNKHELPGTSRLLKKKVGNRNDYRRVVVTGYGVVAPSGIGCEQYWNGLKQGMNCVGPITFFDSTEFSAKAAAEIKEFKPEEYIEDKSQIRRMGRSSHLAVAGALLAIRDANLQITEDLISSMGVLLGSAVSGLEYVETDFRALERGGPRKVRPYLGIAGFGGAISSEISRVLGIHGPSITISTGCTSSTDAMGYAFDLIRSGKSDVFVTGGADACVTPGILAAFCQMGAVSTWQENLERASRPFNKDRGGFVISEGAWIAVFEELEHALKRKAKIYGEVVGYGATCCAWHMAKPHPSGEYTAAAILKALDDAQLPIESIDLFEAYGNGTPVNDSYETNVVKRAFGTHAYKLLMPSIKSMLGHPLGASGAQQLGGALLAFKEGIVHPTINYEFPDPECDLNYVPNKAIKKDVKTALLNSVAFGAKNAALVLKRYQD